MVIKKFNRSESPKKFMQVCIDVTCMYTDFGGRGLFCFGDTATLKNGQFTKKFNQLESAQKIHACMD